MVATGRFQSPAIPAVSGLEGSRLGRGHLDLPVPRDTSPYCGKRVLVAGGAISALEIAAERCPARRGPRRRRSAAAALRAAEVRRGSALRPSDVRAGSEPRRPSASPSRGRPAAERMWCRGGREPRAVRCLRGQDPRCYAGVTLSQQYLPLVAEGLELAVGAMLDGVRRELRP